MNELKNLLNREWPRLAPAICEQFCAFQRLVEEENKKQNLTKNVAAADFYWGHLKDIQEFSDLFHKRLADQKPSSCFDLGSGVGVPGIPLALLNLPPDSKWILCDSLKKRAAFLKEVIGALSIKNVKVSSERADKALILTAPKWIFSRATSNISKLFEWSQKCSTWNKMILFKGPSWDEEWKLAIHLHRKLKIEILHAYKTLDPNTHEEKKRQLVILSVVRDSTRS